MIFLNNKLIFLKKDKYLHTNCLAALANMSSKFLNLHPYVCQRLNSLFNLLSKKRTKIITQLNVDNTSKNENEAADQKADNNGKDLVNFFFYIFRIFILLFYIYILNLN
jgi:hypothetical protein